MSTTTNQLRKLAGIPLVENVVGQFRIIDIDLYTQEFTGSTAQGADAADALANYLQDPEAAEQFRADLQSQDKWGLKVNPDGGWAYKGEEQLILIMQ